MKNRPQMYATLRRQGQYYVQYDDGLETGLMTHLEAKSLAKIFGGQVKKENPQ